MTQDPGWRIIQSAFRCSAELQDLLQFLKEHGSSGEYERYRLAIAAAIDTINVQLTGKVLSARPELEHRIETELNTSGRIT